MQRAKEVKAWREEASILAMQAKIPSLSQVVVSVETGFKGVRQDVGNCHGCTKAIVDGIVDTGVIPDDKPQYLRGIFYAAPVKAKSDWIKVTVHEVDGSFDYHLGDG